MKFLVLFAVLCHVALGLPQLTSHENPNVEHNKPVVHQPSSSSELGPEIHKPINSHGEEHHSSLNPHTDIDHSGTHSGNNHAVTKLHDPEEDGEDHSGEDHSHVKPIVGHSGGSLDAHHKISRRGTDDKLPATPVHPIIESVKQNNDSSVRASVTEVDPSTKLPLLPSVIIHENVDNTDSSESN